VSTDFAQFEHYSEELKQLLAKGFDRNTYLRIYPAAEAKQGESKMVLNPC
jgi:hypothetical protein